MARPLLAVDPGPTVLRWGWFLWVSWAVVGTGLLGEDRGGSGFALGLVLSAPFWALWLLWPVYRGWAFWSRWRRGARGREWQVTNFEFDGRPVRVLVDDDRIWFAADDVFEALGLEGDGREAERARITAASDGWLEHDGSGLLVLSQQGLAAWLERRADPEALKFGRWVDLQVIDPLRRRREHGGA